MSRNITRRCKSKNANIKSRYAGEDGVNWSVSFNSLLRHHTSWNILFVCKDSCLLREHVDGFDSLYQSVTYSGAFYKRDAPYHCLNYFRKVRVKVTKNYFMLFTSLVCSILFWTCQIKWLLSKTVLFTYQNCGLFLITVKSNCLMRGGLNDRDKTGERR